MANKIDPKGVAALEEALQMEMLVIQALVDLLVSKGIISHAELQVRIQQLSTPA